MAENTSFTDCTAREPTVLVVFSIYILCVLYREMLVIYVCLTLKETERLNKTDFCFIKKP